MYDTHDYPDEDFRSLAVPRSRRYATMVEIHFKRPPDGFFDDGQEVDFAPEPRTYYMPDKIDQAVEEQIYQYHMRNLIRMQAMQHGDFQPTQPYEPPTVAPRMPRDRPPLGIRHVVIWLASLATVGYFLFK